MTPGAEAPPLAARRARAAVATLFFTNGAIFASVVPRYPDLKANLELSNAALGSAVSAFWLGALVVGLAGGALITRWGSARVATVVTVIAAANLALIGSAPSWVALAGALAVAGSVDTLADVAENAHALRVERLYRRSILNSLHGVWSIGAVAGGAAGAAAAGADVGLALHLSIAGAVLAVLALAASRFLLDGPERDTPPAAARPGRTRLPLGAVGVVAALGLVATLAQAIEDTGATWSAVYLRTELGATAAVAGAGFVALQSMQTVGRLLGDRVVTRYGDRTVGRCGAALAGVAMAAALALHSPAVTIAAFGVAGLGIATLIPAAMRGADGLPGLAPGVGLTLVGTVSRVGSLAVPPAIGLVADASSLRVGLLAVPLAAVALVVLSRALRNRSGAQSAHQSR